MKTKNILKYSIMLISVIIIVELFIKFSFHESLLVSTLIAMTLAYVFSSQRSQTRYVIQLSALFLIFYVIIIITLRGYISLKHAVLLGFPIITLLAWTLTFVYSKFLSQKTILITLLLTLFLLEVPIRIVRYSTTQGSLPTFIFALLGIIIGFLLFKRKNLKIFSFSIIILLFAIWTYCDGYAIWMNKCYYGTFTRRIQRELPGCALQSEDGDTILLSQMKKEIVLLDFWSNKCPACWNTFPQIQKLYEKYLSDEKIAITSVFVEYKKGEWENNIKRLREKKYTFPTFKITKDNPIVAKLPIKVFPTVILLNDKGVVIYRGDIKEAIRILKSLKYIKK